MLKDIKNKSLKSEEIKSTKTMEHTITVYLKNHTSIDGIVYPAGNVVLTIEQYEKIKDFL